jgi:hypothetical protein
MANDNDDGVSGHEALTRIHESSPIKRREAVGC